MSFDEPKDGDVVMSWKCNAITNGLAIFSNGKIGPCCQISPGYLKPITEIANPARFNDLLTEDAPLACETCAVNENNNIPSYRQFFNSYNIDDENEKIAFLDIRNTNLCNLKCRYCGPHFSNQWAKELEYKIPLKHVSINQYIDKIISDNLQVLYFTGGEPIISADHWELLEVLVNRDLAKNITLMYNTNLTVLKYKELNINDLWGKFKRINLMVSFESVGRLFENIRSNASWQEFELNFKSIKNYNVDISAAAVLSILNVWQLDEFVEFCINNDIKINFTLLNGPDYLALDVIPDEFKNQAIDQLTKARRLLGKEYDSFFALAIDKVNNNINHWLVDQTIAHVLLLDKIRSENMFDFLPFKKISKDLILKNFEYE